MTKFKQLLAGLWAKAWGKINGYLSSDKFRADAERAIRMAGDALVRAVPGSLDDAAWELIKTKFPNLLTGAGTITTDEAKLAALAIATELLKKLQPALSTSEARAAVQVAYLESKTNG